MSQRNKPGAKLKIGPDQQKQVLAVVSNGGSIADAADIVGVTRKTLQNAMRRDRNFYAGVKKAKKSGKIRLIQKVTGSTAWQAAAWYLERMYGSEFGKRDKLDVTTAGKAILVDRTTYEKV